MPTDDAVLIVGGDGTIGGALAARLADRGVPHRCTSRRSPAGNGGAIELDLARDPAAWSLPPRVSTAVVAAATTSIEACRSRPEEARLVNVTGTVALARRLAASGAHVLFLSTNMVFDGSIPFVAPDATRCPRTSYGRMKAEVEEALLSLGHQVTVVRLTKVLAPSAPLFARWRGALMRGEPIHPFSDMPMAPVSLSFVVDVLEDLIRDPVQGILHVSATADLTYADAAVHLAGLWNANPSLVRPVPTATATTVVEHLPTHATLDTSCLVAKLGRTPSPPWAALDVLKAAPPHPAQAQHCP